MKVLFSEKFSAARPVSGRGNLEEKLLTAVQIREKGLRGKYYTVCFFFIEPKVFVNLTYLYLSEIKKQGLIFSVGMGHLKIRKKDFRKSSSLVTNSVQRWHLKFGFLTIRLLGLSTSMVS